ncbi:MAG: 7-carboxy-7-deazaguanine synthase QueE [Fimbriimonadaceae bacterium]
MAALRIAEIFTSIQGEGMWVGQPSTFVRISGCNLRCVWCDTPYASWNPEGPVLSIDAIFAQVKCEHVVVTGGEPMLFDGTEELVWALSNAGHTITIETAGTIYRELPCQLMSISPKLANSDPVGDAWQERHRSTRLDRSALPKLAHHYRHQFKFVVNPEVDLEGQIIEIHEIVDPIGSEFVMLMAEGIDAETLHRRERLLVPVCIEKGWRLSPRLHVDLFGNTRGT